MKKLIFLLIISNNGFAQINPSSFLQNTCDFKSENHKYSLGVKLKLSIPCLWKEFPVDENEEQIKFNYASGKNSISEILSIHKLPESPTPKDLNDFYSQKSLTELGQSAGTFISARKTQIDGIACGEVMLKSITQFPLMKIYVYSLQYYFLYKDKMIILAFTTGSPTDNTSKQLFKFYENMFKRLSKMTKFIEK